jgi:hypothetical protein
MLVKFSDSDFGREFDVECKECGTKFEVKDRVVREIG